MEWKPIYNMETDLEPGMSPCPSHVANGVCPHCGCPGYRAHHNPFDKTRKRFLCKLGWHKLYKSSGMYGDLAVNCFYCRFTRYSSKFMNFIYKITGRMM